MAIRLTIQEDRPKLTVGQGSAIPLRASSGYPIYENNYDNLRNKPSINGVTLEGDKTTEDLGIEAGVTSWNGQTGDVTYTPPNYALTYDESVSLGSAVVGEAVTGEPNYTPTGVVSGSVTTRQETFMTGGAVTVTGTYSNYKLYLGAIFTPTTTTKNIVTEIGDLTFTGNGVKFAVEQEN
jgi:hypothetical protein